MTDDAKPKRKPRPPARMTDEVRAAIVMAISLGQSLKATCRKPGMPGKTAVLKALAADPVFAKQYAEARVRGIELHIDEIIDLADSATAENYNAVRLKVDTRKWLASKLAPKVYGDHIQLEADLPLQPPATIDLIGLGREIAWTLRRADAATGGPIALPAPPPPEPPPPPIVERYRHQPTGSPAPEHPGAAFLREAAERKESFSITEWNMLTGEDFYRLPPHRRPRTVVVHDARDNAYEQVVEPIADWRRRTEAMA